MFNTITPSVGKSSVDEYTPIVASNKRKENLHNNSKITDETYLNTIKYLERSPKKDQVF